ncbi:hypothetical protein CMI45_02755 [Candidatus Pacearchaeota archaeon]|nr:hypothetical protein [Candidatus Pacearchaeota archaeon]|tara:strand:- start:1305 stop:3188 length:1884 start_codon:yes stop_codon:yes gene_type:complete
MADYTHNIYTGVNYNFAPDYSEGIADVPASQIGTAVNAQTANQLHAVSQALNTGQNVVEVQMTFPDIEKEIPNKHLDEINRLRKLTGAQLTLHGPMLEPTGVDAERGNWTEDDRRRVEDRMWFALERGKRIDPEGNIVVTFHASTGLPEVESKVKMPDGTEKVTHIGAVNRLDGKVGPLDLESRKDFLSGSKTPEKILEDINEQSWATELSNINMELARAKDHISHALKTDDDTKGVKGIPQKPGEILEEVQKYKEFTPEQKKAYGAATEGYIDLIENRKDALFTGDIYLRDAQNKFKQLFNQAYKYAEEKGLEKEKGKLDDFSKKWKEAIDAVKAPSGAIEDYRKIPGAANTLREGLDMLNSIKAPESWEPIKEFALEKASETFSNLAIKSYDEFKDAAPIISLENHPASPMSGFNRADHMKELIERIREDFTKKAQKKFGMSKSQAVKQAEKMIGVTWDVGHINNLRKFGYDTKDIVKETEKITPYIKHVHLADNMGLEDAELPIGWGNVPMKEHEAVLKKMGVNPEKIKRIAETATYIQQFGGSSPLPEILGHYNSPIYAMQNGPYWSQAQGAPEGYSYNMGPGYMLPDATFSLIYGGSHTGLPIELGGELPGGRSRFSGAPMS